MTGEVGKNGGDIESKGNAPKGGARTEASSAGGSVSLLPRERGARRTTSLKYEDAAHGLRERAKGLLSVGAPEGSASTDSAPAIDLKALWLDDSAPEDIKGFKKDLMRYANDCLSLTKKQAGPLVIAAFEHLRWKPEDTLASLVDLMACYARKCEVGGKIYQERRYDTAARDFSDPIKFIQYDVAEIEAKSREAGLSRTAFLASMYYDLSNQEMLMPSQDDRHVSVAAGAASGSAAARVAGEYTASVYARHQAYVKGEVRKRVTEFNTHVHTPGAALFRRVYQLTGQGVENISRVQRQACESLVSLRVVGERSNADRLEAFEALDNAQMKYLLSNPDARKALSQWPHWHTELLPALVQSMKQDSTRREKEVAHRGRSKTRRDVVESLDEDVVALLAEECLLNHWGRLLDVLSHVAGIADVPDHGDNNVMSALARIVSLHASLGHANKIPTDIDWNRFVPQSCVRTRSLCHRPGGNRLPYDRLYFGEGALESVGESSSDEDSGATSEEDAPHGAARDPARAAGRTTTTGRSSHASDMPPALSLMIEIEMRVLARSAQANRKHRLFSLERLQSAVNKAGGLMVAGTRGAAPRQTDMCDVLSLMNWVHDHGAGPILVRCASSDLSISSVALVLSLIGRHPSSMAYFERGLSDADDAGALVWMLPLCDVRPTLLSADDDVSLRIITRVCSWVDRSNGAVTHQDMRTFLRKKFSQERKDAQALFMGELLFVSGDRAAWLRLMDCIAVPLIRDTLRYDADRDSAGKERDGTAPAVKLLLLCAYPHLSVDLTEQLLTLFQAIVVDAAVRADVCYSVFRALAQQAALYHDALPDYTARERELENTFGLDGDTPLIDTESVATTSAFTAAGGAAAGDGGSASAVRAVPGGVPSDGEAGRSALLANLLAPEAVGIITRLPCFKMVQSGFATAEADARPLDSLLFEANLAALTVGDCRWLQRSAFATDAAVLNALRDFDALSRVIVHTQAGCVDHAHFVALHKAYEQFNKHLIIGADHTHDLGYVRAVGGLLSPSGRMVLLACISPKKLLSQVTPDMRRDQFSFLGKPLTDGADSHAIALFSAWAKGYHAHMRSVRNLAGYGRTLLEGIDSEHIQRLPTVFFSINSRQDEHPDQEETIRMGVTKVLAKGSVTVQGFFYAFVASTLLDAASMNSFSYTILPDGTQKDLFHGLLDVGIVSPDDGAQLTVQVKGIRVHRRFGCLTRQVEMDAAALDAVYNAVKHTVQADAIVGEDSCARLNGIIHMLLSGLPQGSGTSFQADRCAIPWMVRRVLLKVAAHYEKSYGYAGPACRESIVLGLWDGMHLRTIKKLQGVDAEVTKDVSAYFAGVRRYLVHKPAEVRQNRNMLLLSLFASAALMAFSQRTNDQSDNNLNDLGALVVDLEIIGAFVAFASVLYFALQTMALGERAKASCHACCHRVRATRRRERSGDAYHQLREKAPGAAAHAGTPVRAIGSHLPVSAKLDVKHAPGAGVGSP